MATASIARYSQHPAGYTEYVIKVFYLGQEWATKKRFSDFTALDVALRASGLALPCTLPEKSWWSKFDADFLMNRMKALQLYLEKLMMVTPLHGLVKEFLEVDKNMLDLERKRNTSSRALRKADKILSIVNKAKSKFIVIDTRERIVGSVRKALPLGRNGTGTGGAPGTPTKTRGPTVSVSGGGPSSPMKMRQPSSTLVEGGRRWSAQSSFSSVADEPPGGGFFHGLARSISITKQEELRVELEKSIESCLSRPSHSLELLQQEQFVSMSLHFPDKINDVRAIISMPIPMQYLDAAHSAVDSIAQAVEDRRMETSVASSAGMDLLTNRLICDSVA
jgi:hypothetical protein